MAQPSTQRYECIDIFRGLTMFFMLMVTNPGNPSNIPAQLQHASWHGVTLADFVFPFFIFIMGVSVPAAINKRLEQNVSPKSILTHILVRSIELFLLGLILNGFPYFDLNTIRIPGVLQRIAVVYLISSLLLILAKNIFKKEIYQMVFQLSVALFFLLFILFIIKVCTCTWIWERCIRASG